MESLKYSKNNEDFVSNLDFPFCELHKKLQIEFVCLEDLCKFSRKPLCSFCFKQNHEQLDKPHIKYEIRTVLCYLLENQNFLFDKEEILKTLPFYNTIPEKLNLIETKVLELQKMKNLLVEMKTQIDDRIEACIYFKDNLKGIIQKENEKNNLNNLLDKFLKIIGKNGPNSLNVSEFSEDEKNTFGNQLENINKAMECKELQLQMNNCFIFDNLNRAEDISVVQNKICKRLSEKKNEERFCFLMPKLSKYSKILLKIKNLSNWIGLGVVKYEFIRKNKFKFNYLDTQISQRGYYLISSNGYCWSDCDDSIHRKELSFKFVAGDLISIIYDQENRILVLEDVAKGQKTTLKMQQPCVGDQYVFAVNLCGTNDEIQIID